MFGAKIPFFELFCKKSGEKVKKPFVSIIQHNLPDSLREKSFIGSL